VASVLGPRPFAAVGTEPPAAVAPPRPTTAHDSDDGSGPHPEPNYISRDVDQWRVVGDYLAVHWGDRTGLDIWNLRTGKPVGSWLPDEAGMVWMNLAGSGAAGVVIVHRREQPQPYTFVYDGIDIASGKELFTLPMSQFGLLHAGQIFPDDVGFTSDGKTFFIASPLRVLYAIDARSGKIVRQQDLENENIFGSLLWARTNISRTRWEATVVSPDGSICALCMDDKIVAIDQHGKEIWRRTPGKGDGAFEFPSVDSPPMSRVMAAVVVQGAESHTLLSLDIATGKPIGQLDNIAHWTARDVSRDGKQVLFITPDGWAIRSMAYKDKIIRLPKSQCGVFGETGKLVYAMPVEEIISYDEKTDTLTTGMPSTSLYTYDAETGTLVSRLELTRLTTTPSTRP